MTFEIWEAKGVWIQSNMSKAIKRGQGGIAIEYSQNK